MHTDGLMRELPRPLENRSEHSYSAAQLVSITNSLSFSAFQIFLHGPLRIPTNSKCPFRFYQVQYGLYIYIACACKQIYVIIEKIFFVIPRLDKKEK